MSMMPTVFVACFVNIT